MSRLGDFQDNGDGTVTDNYFGHVWRNGDDWPEMDWYEAMKLEGSIPYQSLSERSISAVAGIPQNMLYGWRLPTLDELLSLNYNLWEEIDPVPSTYNDGREDWFFETVRNNKRRYFPNLKQAFYWTRETAQSKVMDASEYAISLSFIDIDQSVQRSSLKTVASRVMLIRGNKGPGGVWL